MPLPKSPANAPSETFVSPKNPFSRLLARIRGPAPVSPVWTLDEMPRLPEERGLRVGVTPGGEVCAVNSWYLGQNLLYVGAIGQGSRSAIESLATQHALGGGTVLMLDGLSGPLFAERLGAALAQRNLPALRLVKGARPEGDIDWRSLMGGQGHAYVRLDTLDDANGAPGRARATVRQLAREMAARAESTGNVRLAWSRRPALMVVITEAQLCFREGRGLLLRQAGALGVFFVLQVHSLAELGAAQDAVLSNRANKFFFRQVTPAAQGASAQLLEGQVTGRGSASWEQSLKELRPGEAIWQHDNVATKVLVPFVNGGSSGR
jgi:hypothetical protein